MFGEFHCGYEFCVLQTGGASEIQVVLGLVILVMSATSSTSVLVLE